MIADTLDSDLLIGAARIARHIFGNDEYRFRRRVYSRTSDAKCRPPRFHIGFQLAARKSQIRHRIEAQEGCR